MYDGKCELQNFVLMTWKVNLRISSHVYLMEKRPEINFSRQHFCVENNYIPLAFSFSSNFATIWLYSSPPATPESFVSFSFTATQIPLLESSLSSSSKAWKKFVKKCYCRITEVENIVMTLYAKNPANIWIANWTILLLKLNYEWHRTFFFFLKFYQLVMDRLIEFGF